MATITPSLRAGEFTFMKITQGQRKQIRNGRKTNWAGGLFYSYWNGFLIVMTMEPDCCSSFGYYKGKVSFSCDHKGFSQDFLKEAFSKGRRLGDRIHYAAR